MSLGQFTVVVFEATPVRAWVQKRVFERTDRRRWRRCWRQVGRHHRGEAQESALLPASHPLSSHQPFDQVLQGLPVLSHVGRLWLLLQCGASVKDAYTYRERSPAPNVTSASM